MIGILDNGLCNIGSVANMLNQLGVSSVTISDNSDGSQGVAGLILPGVGNFGPAMKSLKERGLDSLIMAATKNKVPLLGICLGMQLLASYSEESDCEGLGLVNATVRKFDRSSDIVDTVPNMGWALTKFHRESPLCEERMSNQRFYFTHSYHVVCGSPETELAVSRNGRFEFTAAISSGLVFGCQFHPEKSHSFGKSLMRGFSKHCLSNHV